MSSTTPAAKSPFELKGWHALLILIGFFAVVLGVDGAFTVMAYRSHPGEVTAKPYEEGLAFNRTLGRRAEERALGWKAQVEVSAAEVGRNRIRLVVKDAAGEPVRDLELKGRLERPATAEGAVAAAFTETRPGTYDTLVPDAPGAWDLSVTGVDSNARPFEAERRLVWR